MNKVEFSRAVKVPFAKRYGNFIGGKWAEPISGKYFENMSPVNGLLLCEVARSDAQDVELALDAAHAAKDAWARTSVAERALIVRCGSTEAKRLRRRILTLVEELGVRMGDDGMEYVEIR